MKKYQVWVHISVTSHRAGSWLRRTYCDVFTHVQLCL